MQLDLALAATAFVVLVLGVLSGWIRTGILSEPLLALVSGIALGPEITGVLDPSRWATPHDILREGTRLTLGVSLMGVALRLPRGHVTRSIRSLAVLLGLGMPAMWMVSSVLVLLTMKLPLAMCLLVGAAVTPTDPVVASAIVTGKVAEQNLPSRLRDLLSAESGANDGLALPFVAAGLSLHAGTHGGWGEWILQYVVLEVGGAVAFGCALGWVAGRLLTWALRRDEIEKTSRLAYALALSLAALAAGHILHLNEVLAVFVAGLAFDAAVSERDRTEEAAIQEAVNRFFMLPVFVLLGVMLPWSGWRELGLTAPLLVAAILTLRRLPAILLMRPLLREARVRSDALYVGWFGPIGVAALYYALHARERAGVELPWLLVSMVVVGSVVVHGISATPLTKAYGRRGGRAEAARDE